MEHRHQEQILLWVGMHYLKYNKLIYSTNNSNIQINVKGWKWIQKGNLKGAMVDMYTNGKLGYFTVQANATNTSSGAYPGLFPEALTPAISVTLPMNVFSTNKILIQKGTGEVYVQINDANKPQIHIGLIYPLEYPAY